MTPDSADPGDPGMSSKKADSHVLEDEAIFSTKFGKAAQGTHKGPKGSQRDNEYIFINPYHCFFIHDYTEFGALVYVGARSYAGT